MSSRTDYAVRTVLHLAMHRNDGAVRIADIARRQKIPYRFLAQILLTLKGAGLVQSKRGIKGGYLLARDPDKIPLSALVGLTEGGLLGGRAETGRELLQMTAEHASVSELWWDIDRRLRDKLDHTTIQDLCDRVDDINRRLAGHYAI